MRVLRLVPNVPDDSTPDLVLDPTPPDTLAATYSRWFEKLWKIYPRKCSKAASFKAFTSRKPTLELCKTIHADIVKRVRDGDWGDKDRIKFIPYFSTYLHQERWLDEE